MNFVDAFAHLCHIWGLFGFITFLVYANDTRKALRSEGVEAMQYPDKALLFAGRQLKYTVKDLVSLAVGLYHGLIGIGAVVFDDRSAYTLRNSTVLMLGISLGGLSRFFTSLYWALVDMQVLITSMPVAIVPMFLAVIADTNHHHIVWHKKPWRGRFLMVFAFTWVVLGALGIF